MPELQQYIHCLKRSSTIQAAHDFLGINEVKIKGPNLGGFTHKVSFNVVGLSITTPLPNSVSIAVQPAVHGPASFVWRLEGGDHPQPL